jgi:hypothetical protein
MPSKDERRRATRVRTSIQAQLAIEGRESLTVALENLSLVGLCGDVGVELTLGERGQVFLRSGDHAVDARARIVWTERTRVAVRFDVLPFECLEHLRRLLRAHAQDPAQIDNEISERLGHLGDCA